jgi:hypothetical protein
MARTGDIGPYAVGNVRIVTARENLRERRPSSARGKLHSARILDMLRAGIPETAVALYFGVLPSTVASVKRLRRVSV